MGKKRIYQSDSFKERAAAKDSIVRLSCRLKYMDDITAERARWSIALLRKIYGIED